MQTSSKFGLGKLFSIIIAGVSIGQLCPRLVAQSASFTEPASEYPLGSTKGITARVSAAIEVGNAKTPLGENIYGSLPLSFEANQGQADARVRFLARVSGYTLFVTSNEVVFAGRDGSVERMKLIGVQRSMRMEQLDRQPGLSNYFIGNDPSKWRTNILNYGRMALRGVYPGIDLIFYGNQRQLEYDWVVAPGADPKQIRVKWEDRTRLTKNAGGDLVVSAALVQQKPVILQAGKRIEGGYLVRGREVGFALANYDMTKPLVIDPVLLYSTYLGGNGGDAGRAIAVDGSGNVYVTGSTFSTDFPTAHPLQGSNGSSSFQSDVFVTKINATGAAIVYSTYLGGSGSDTSSGIAVDGSGNAYVTGQTSSANFPTADPLQGSTGDGDAFVAKIAAAGSALVYSTYLGGRGGNSSSGIAVDGSGNAYVTGSTSSTRFPTTNALQSSLSGVQDAFVTKINAAGSAYVYSTYLGGSGSESSGGIAVDGSGNAYVTGSTSSTDFPTTNPLQPNLRGALNAFVTKINAAGSAHVYSTYLGGSVGDQGIGIAVDGSGNAYVTGSTESTNFPTRNPLQGSYGGGFSDAFVAKINAAGTALVYSTFLGGTDDDSGVSIAVDRSGNAYVTGSTFSSNFPAANPLRGMLGQFEAFQGDPFATQINAEGSALVYSTCLGGSGGDYGLGIAVDGSGNAYVTGGTSSPDFPTANPLQSRTAGNEDAFVLSIGTPSPPPDPGICNAKLPAPPVIGAVTNSASNRAGPVAPGEIVVVYGSNMGPAQLAQFSLNAAGLVGTSLACTQVFFNGVPAPVIYSSAGQVAAIVPYVPPPGLLYQVTISYQGQSSQALSIPFAAAAAGLITANSTGSGQAAAINPDGSLNSASSPARTGSVIVLYATGEGFTNPPGIDGKPASAPLPTPFLVVTATIGGQPAAVQYAGGAPGFVAGLMQVNVVIPANISPGAAVPVVLKVADSQSQGGVTIAVAGN